jgi:hypothetical protein
MRGLHLAIHDCLGPSTAAIEFEFGNHLSMSLVHARERRLAVTEFVFVVRVAKMFGQAEKSMHLPIDPIHDCLGLSTNSA